MESLITKTYLIVGAEETVIRINELEDPNSKGDCWMVKYIIPAIPFYDSSRPWPIDTSKYIVVFGKISNN